MKKYLLLLMVTLPTLTKAQTEAGNMLLAGATDLTFLSSDVGFSDNINNLSLDLGVGWFVADGFAIGPSVSYERQWINDFSSDLSVLSAFGRYYINNGPFLGASVGITNASEDDGFDDGSVSGTAIGLEFGYAAFINDVVAIEPSFQYAKMSGDFDTTSYGVNLGITLFF